MQIFLYTYKTLIFNSYFSRSFLETKMRVQTNKLILPVLKVIRDEIHAFNSIKKDTCALKQFEKFADFYE
jgi:hypothetical protein